MKIVPIVLFAGTLIDIPEGCVARPRRSKRGHSTQVSCAVEPRDNRFYAVPQFTPAENTVAPTFKLQLRMNRRIGDKYGQLGVVLQPEKESRMTDPEQRILKPLLSDDFRVFFEFTRADVLAVDSDGVVTIRFAAIDPESGQVGTREREIDESYARLVQRCTADLAGGERLFPASRKRSGPVPNGVPVLEFARRVEPEADIATVGLG